MTFRPVNAWVGFFIVTLLLGLSNGAAGAADPVVVPAVESSSPNYGARLFANDELFTTNDRSVATEHGGQIAAMNAAFDGTRMPPVRYTPVDVNEVLAAKSAAANPEHPAEGRAYFRARQADFHDAVRAAGLPQNNSTSACAYLVDSMYSVSGVTPTYRDKDGFRAACLFDVAREIVDHNNFFPESSAAQEAELAGTIAATLREQAKVDPVAAKTYANLVFKKLVGASISDIPPHDFVCTLRYDPSEDCAIMVRLLDSRLPSVLRRIGLDREQFIF